MGSLIFHEPFHVVTRGRFDGQYGIATRGLLVCPDIVPRYPQDAVIEVDEEPIAVVEEPAFWAEVLQVDLLAVVTDMPLAFKASVVELVPDLVATVLDVMDMAAEVFDEDEELGAVEDADQSAELEESGTIGEVVEDDAEAELGDDGLVGSVEDEPPHC